MHYQEFHPEAPLNSFIECFWTLRDLAPAESQPERILPDGCAEIILNFGDRFLQHGPNRRVLQPRYFFVGQITGPMLISPTGTVNLIGIRFHPGGTKALLRLDLDQTTNEVVDLGDSREWFPSEWLDRLVNLRSIEDRLSLLESLLCLRLQGVPSDMTTLRLARKIVKHHGVISIDELSRAAGISGRQLERRFRREVGLGPKMLGRILRFQHVFRAVEHDDPAWATLAVECGYYDQAHLIRDFRQFADQTPAALIAQRTILTEAFTRKRRDVAFLQDD